MSEVPVNTSTPKLIYILYLAGILIPFISIIGLVMAYINKDDAPEWLQSHYQFQIRTFWIGFLYAFIGLLLMMMIIGYFVLLFTVIWLVIRMVKGMKYLDAQQAHPNPTTWIFS
ncbi:MAG: hypothetical protein COA63_008490 [Methylophaga sp.]|nr:hypothetical protein [Methylophaga sp.]